MVGQTELSDRRNHQEKRLCPGEMEDARAHLVVYARLTVLQPHAESLGPRLLCLFHDVDSPRRLGRAALICRTHPLKAQHGASFFTSGLLNISLQTLTDLFPPVWESAAPLPCFPSWPAGREASCAAAGEKSRACCLLGCTGGGGGRHRGSFIPNCWYRQQIRIGHQEPCTCSSIMR